MAQQENDGFAQFTASGGELNVPFDFKISDRAELKIIRTRAGVETTLVLNTDYTIADNQLNVDLGGVAVLIGSATPAVAADIYTALLNTPYSRGTLDGSSDFNQSGDFFAQTLNRQFDYVIRMINRLARDTGKSLKFSETLNISTAIITESIAAGKALIAGASPGTFEEGPDAGQIAAAQGYATNAATSASNAAASETAAQSWATAAQSAATGINWTKARVASTANVNIASPGATMDGVTLALNDRVLLKNQSTASQNGIYVWNGAAVAMTRAADMDTWAEVVSKVVQIEEGTVNADLPYMATVNTGGTLGSTSITFVLFQAPLQDGAVSTAAKIADGIIDYIKLAASSIAALSDWAAGTSSKVLTANNFLPAILAALGFNKYYESAELSLTAGTKQMVSHSLGVQPRLSTVSLRCKTAEFGHSVGDEVTNFSWRERTANPGVQNNMGYELISSSTQVGVTMASSFITVLDASGVYQAITPANWRFVLRAWG